jgi:hypothetical protein
MTAMSRWTQVTLICLAVAVLALAAVAFLLGKDAIIAIGTIFVVLLILLVWFWNSFWL